MEIISAVTIVTSGRESSKKFNQRNVVYCEETAKTFLPTEAFHQLRWDALFFFFFLIPASTVGCNLQHDLIPNYHARPRTYWYVIASVPAHFVLVRVMDL